MKNALSLIKDSNLLKMVIAVVIGVFFVVGGVQAATTISTNIATAGTIIVGEDGTGADVTFYGDTAGSYWLWDQSADTMIVKAGVASTSALKVGDEIASTINGLVFGYCTLAAIDVSAATTTYAYCTGATGVISGDRVFVQATSSMPTATWITAASSTATAGQINVRLHAEIGATAIGAGTVSLNVWAVRD